MVQKKRFRYPGIDFFKKKDHDIFCGRAGDSERLFTRIMNNNTMVLHGESGAGKSSLVQAGILPLLDKRNEDLAEKQKPQYLPVTIRFDSISKSSGGDKDPEDDDILISKVLYEIKHQCKVKTKELPYISPKQYNFWYLVKTYEYNNYTLLLIFDQFEELQGFNYKEAEIFVKRLSELFVSTMPQDIYKEYDDKTAEILMKNELTEEDRKKINDNIEFLEQPLSVRLLFIIREDRLGTMSLLADYFPDILKNNFLLQRLDKKNAARAIEDPAQKDGNFLTGKFTYDQEAKDSLLQNLVDPNTNRFDPFQLQIVCGSIERNIAINKKVITLKDIPAVNDILSDFYYEIWDEIKKEYKLPDGEFEKKRKAIIGKLVVERRRNLVLENILVSEYNQQDKKIIASLTKKGLLKKVPSSNDTSFYQLSHDRLMEPVIEDLLEIDANEKSQIELQNRVKEEKVKFEYTKAFIVRNTIISTNRLKQLIGGVLMLLPVFLVLAKLITKQPLTIEFSISDYYDKGAAGDILVGILFVFGFLLLTYRGYGPIDSATSKLACIASLGTAIFPVTASGSDKYLHFVFFFLLFLVLIFFNIFLFRKTGPWRTQTRQKKMRNVVYLTCGIIMMVCLIFIALYTFLFTELNNKYRIVFWLESLLFYSAGFSWLIKGEALLKDYDPYNRPEERESEKVLV